MSLKLLARPSKPATAFLLLILFALCLRLAGILSRPIWYDEAFSILISESNPSDILAGTLSLDSDASSAEEHPPAYYHGLWAWMKLFGNSVLSARLASVMAGVTLTGMAYLIAQQLFGEKTALTAGLFIALFPFQVHYSQEIRMYVFLALWLSMATYFFITKKWVFFSLSAVLAQYTHHLAIIYLIPLAATPAIARDWKTSRSVFLSGLAAILLYAPWLIHLPAQLAKVSRGFWIEQPGLERIFTLLLYYTTHLPLPGWWLIPGLFLALLITALCLFQTWIAFREKPGWENSGVWLLYMAFAPPLLLWCLSFIHPLYVERALLPSHVMFCLWLGWVFTQTKMPAPILALCSTFVILACGMGLYQHVAYTGFPYGPFQDLTQNVKKELQPGDVVIHSSKLSYLPAFYFDRVLPQGFVLDPPGSNVDTLSPATRQILGLSHYESVMAASENADRIWFIIYQRSIDEFTSELQHTHPHLQYLDEHFVLENTLNLGDLRVYLYSREKYETVDAQK